MFSFFSIICIYAIIIKSHGNPVINNNNVTDVENSDYESQFLCDRNIFLIVNQSLFELLNADRFWFVLARSKFIYGEQTWKNSLMKTTINNDTIYLEFIGENSNGSCVTSEKAQMSPDIKTNRVSIQWANGEEGFLEMVFLDETLTLYIICYLIDSNKTDTCAHNKSEQFVAQNNQLEYKNDTMLWLKSHCPSINIDDFIVNDNTKKCLSVVTEPEILEVNTTEQFVDNNNKTIFETSYSEILEKENDTVTSAPEFEFTTRTNRTNRLEVLEEYYSNATNENQLEETTAMEIKEIVLLSANVSAKEDSDRINMTIVEEIVLEPVANETVSEEVPLFVLHKSVMNETAIELLLDHPETTESFITHLSKNNDSTTVHVDTTTPMTSSSIFVNLTTEKPVLNESATFVNPITQKQVLNESSISVNPTTEKPVLNESTTFVNLTTEKLVLNESTTSVNPTTEKLVLNESITSVNPTTLKPVLNESTMFVNPTTEKPVLNESTTFVSLTTQKQVLNESTTSVNSTAVKPVLNESTTSVNVENSTVSVSTEYESSTTMVETTVELTTTEATTSTAVMPADCPVLKDCPFDYCAFARKLDNRGCPTCNCLYSNKSNIICPTFSCQSCLYGHYTDPNGCPVCQCQSRPYPPIGERCPQLNCEPCYFGTVKDEYNCHTCICIRPNNQECPILNCTFGPCKYGSRKDEDDCPTCDCLLPKENTTEVNCSTSVPCPSCHLGYVKDADGCETCQCKLRGSVSCASVSSECHCDYGSYLNSDGCETCSCLPDPKNASRQACWELANQANFHNISGPTCAADGSFYARQCDKLTSKCWCVTPTGIHISGFESKPEENANCACAMELYQVSSLRMIGHHLLCLLNGNYAPIQCDGRYCSCVDENGTPIGPSVSVQNRDQLRCVGVYQQLHPERFLLHRASIEQSNGSRFPHGIFSSLCLTHLEQVRNANITDDHILIPVCDVNGLYAPVQCDQSERYCWCVDKKTGVEMDGTRRLNARPNCNIV